MADLSAENLPELVPVSELIEYPGNARRGDLSSIRASMKRHGWYGAAVRQKSTGYLLVGNHRVRVARELGIERVPVQTLDVDDDTARRILAVDNRTNDLAEYDTVALAELLAGMGDDFDGTGYEPGDLEELQRQIDVSLAGPLNYEEAWVEAGMPDYENSRLLGAFRVVVKFPTMEDADSFFNLIQRPRRAHMWWPAGDGLPGQDKDLRVVADPEA